MAITERYIREELGFGPLSGRHAWSIMAAQIMRQEALSTLLPAVWDDTANLGDWGWRNQALEVGDRRARPQLNWSRRDRREQIPAGDGRALLLANDRCCSLP